LNTNFKRAIAAAAFVLIAAVALFALRVSPYLVVEDAFTGQVLFTYPINNGEFFSIKYIHSVNQSLVTEIFEVGNRDIFLHALEFEDFGAGMATELEPGQHLTRLPCGAMRIDGFCGRGISHYMVARATCQVLYIGGRQVPFDSFAEPGTIVAFSVSEKFNWLARG